MINQEVREKEQVDLQVTIARLFDRHAETEANWNSSGGIPRREDHPARHLEQK